MTVDNTLIFLAYLSVAPAIYLAVLLAQWLKKSAKEACRTIPGRISASLPHPVNRLGFVIFAMGLVVVAACFAASLEPRSYGAYFRVRDFEMYFLSRSFYWWQTGIRYGTVAVCIGLVLAWFFQPTIGRIIRWIRAG